LTRLNKFYIFLLILSLGLLISHELLKPKAINWFQTYVSTHKMPYGTYILYQELSNLFPESDIQKINKPPYLFLEDSTANGAYLFIDKNINFGKTEFDKLLKFVKRGNEVFIATHGINIDTLNLKTKLLRSASFVEKPYFKLVNKNLSQNEYYFDRKFNDFVFKKLDTAATVVLGKSGLLNKNNVRKVSGVNFIKYNYGKGYFLFSTYPEAFINYTILKSPNQKYAAAVLSYLNNPKNIYWDAYYKTGKTQISSPLTYVLTNKNLKWAYYLILLGSLLFVLFNGKRVQRVIPIKKPLVNQSLAFAQTIANMYFKKDSHKTIATHKIRYTLAQIRQKYHIETDLYKAKFKQELALKTGNNIQDIEKSLNYIKQVEAAPTITKNMLLLLNKHLYHLTHPDL